MFKEVYLESVEENQNRRRWYRLTATVDLFGSEVIREWGRIGHKGRRKRHLYESYQSALKELEKIMRLREKHGYYLSKPPKKKVGRRK